MDFVLKVKGRNFTYCHVVVEIVFNNQFVFVRFVKIAKNSLNCFSFLKPEYQMFTLQWVDWNALCYKH